MDAEDMARLVEIARQNVKLVDQQLRLVQHINHLAGDFERMVELAGVLTRRVDNLADLAKALAKRIDAKC